jgi:outer membrane lipoprotein SlyB
MNKYKALLGVVCSAGLLNGCASLSGSVYTRNEARTPLTVSYGTVVGVRPIYIEGNNSNTGLGIGAVAGGLGGAALARGSSGLGQVAAGAAGAVLGGSLEALGEKYITGTKGVEITVKLDSGNTVAYVQADDGTLFNVGDKVQITVGDSTKVSRAGGVP